MNAQCVRCGRPTPDGYADTSCGVSKPHGWLAEIVDALPAARDVANRLSRRGGSGSATGKPGSSLPLDIAATAKLDGLANVLIGWARHVGELRGIEIPQPPVELPDPMIGPLCRSRYECTHDSCKIMRDGDEWDWDAIAVAAQFLDGQLEWMRHRPEVDEFLTDIEAAARVIRSVADRPEDRRVIVGMCDCGKTLYAPRGRQIVVCPDCEQQWDVDDSRETLRAHLDERLVTAAEAAHLAAYLDTDRSSEQIRKLVNKWANRRVLAKHGDVRIKHRHGAQCQPGCALIADMVDTYRFGDIALRMAQTPRRARVDNSTASV